MADGRAEAAVHSAKDMPSVMPARLRAGRGAAGGPTRATAWSGATLAALPAGWRWWPPARPGGGPSWPHLRPDLVFTDLRGNMARRVAVGEEGQVVGRGRRRGRHGAAGLAEARSATCSTRSTCCPRRARAPSPCSAGRTTPATRELLAAIDHEPSHRALRAERAVLAGARWELHACRSAPSPRPASPVTGRPRRVSGLAGQRRRAHRDPAGPARRAIPRRSGPRWRGPCSTGGGAAIEGFDSAPCWTRRRDRLPGRAPARAIPGC